MNLEKFSPYRWFCSFLIACLKPFTVVIETLVRLDVGERYAGFSALMALLILGVDAEFCPPGESALVWLLMAAFAIRVVMLRMAGIRRRRRGYHSIHTRSPGTSILQRMSSRLPVKAIPWIEPFAVMLAAWIVSLLNPTVGDFLLGSGAALLGINLIRMSAAYNKELDATDASIEQDARPMAGVILPAHGVFPPAPMINLRAADPALFPIAGAGDAEPDPQLSSLLPLGGGELWKR